MTDHKLLIAGSRTFNNYDYMCGFLDEHAKFLYPETISVVISGMAKGADTLGAKWATENGILVDRHSALWGTHGRSAGFVRNAEMVTACTEAIIFWDGKSRGTKHTIDLLEKSGKPYLVDVYSGEDEE